MASTLPEVGADDVAYVVDLSGYIFRSFHAITAPLSSATGEPTSVTLGTITMLQRLIGDRKPRYLAVAMDSSSQTFRRDLDPNYKAHRPPAPEELKRQVVRCREVVEAYRLPVFQKDGFEADDLIASVVTEARKHKLRVVIVSADKDLMQLVGADVVLWDTMRNKVYGVPEVQEKFGVGPALLRDALALMGDTSDNVPGVPTVGPKKAAELLLAHGTIDGIYANLAKITQKKLRETLAEHEANARLSQKLVTLRDDMDVGVFPAAMVPGEPDSQRLREIFTELNFTRLLGSLGGAAGASAGAGSAGGATTGGGAAAERPAARPAGAVKRTYRAIVSEEDLSAFVAEARKAAAIAVHTQSTSTDAVSSHLVGVALSIDPAEGVYVPVGHRWLIGPDQLPLARVQALLGPLLRADTPPKVGHDIKHTDMVLKRHGLPLGAVSFDTMIGSYLLDPEAMHGLREVAKRELGEPMTTFDQVTEKQGRNQLSFEQVTLEAATPYAGADAALSLELSRRLAPRVEAESMIKLMTDVELPLARTLAEMELAGVKVDPKVLGAIAVDVDRKLIELEAKAKELAGKEFNVNSPRQLEALLFDELGLPVIKRTKTSRSTDAEVLDALAEKHPLPGVILEHRQLAKLKGTYIDALPQLINPATGRIHTSYNQAVAATGRLSSSDPNLQNIPVRTDVGKAIRAAFVAEKGHLLLAADYSQIELRLLAHLSKDPAMLDAFKSGQDIHTRTAMEIFEKKPDEVTGDMRRAAKTINFGVIYGMGDAALGKRLGIPREEAARFIEAYFTRYAGVKAYMAQVLDEARSAGSVGTLLGRRRFLPDLGSANRSERLQAERIATNTPIQGTAADILKLAMVSLRAPVVEGARMILTVHDELIFEIPEGTEKQVTEQVKAKMEGVVSLSVPLLVEVGFGKSWAEAHG
jgi:DNA polymerase I